MLTDIAAIKEAHANGAGPDMLSVLRALAQRSLWSSEPVGFAWPRFINTDPGARRGAERIHTLTAQAFDGAGELVVTAGTPYEVVITLHLPKAPADIYGHRVIDEVTGILGLDGNPTLPLLNCWGSPDGSATWIMVLKVREP